VRASYGDALTAPLRLHSGQDRACSMHMLHASTPAHAMCTYPCAYAALRERVCIHSSHPHSHTPQQVQAYTWQKAQRGTSSSSLSLALVPHSTTSSSSVGAGCRTESPRTTCCMSSLSSYRRLEKRYVCATSVYAYAEASMVAQVAYITLMPLAVWGLGYAVGNAILTAHYPLSQLHLQGSRW
jgi:hypothetical protein